MSMERRRRPSSLSEETERLMEEALSNWPMRWRRFPATEMGWTPAMELYEKEDKFIVRFELPGVKREEIDISITGDLLRISGERKTPEDVSEEEYYRCEVCYGPYSRAISLPSAVDATKVEARFEDGILTIMLPKSQEAMPSRIEIKGE